MKIYIIALVLQISTEFQVNCIQFLQRTQVMGAMIAHFLDKDTEAQASQVIPGSQWTKCKCGWAPVTCCSEPWASFLHSESEVSGLPKLHDIVQFLTATVGNFRFFFNAGQSVIIPGGLDLS